MIVPLTVTVLWRAYMAFLLPVQSFLHTLPSDPSSPNGKGRLFNGSIFLIFTSSVVTRIWLWHHWRRVRTFPVLLAPDLGKSQVRIRGTHILDHAGLHRTLCHFSSSVSLLPDTSVTERPHCFPLGNSPLLLLAEHRALSSWPGIIVFIYKMPLASQNSTLPPTLSSLLWLLARAVSWHMSAPSFRIPG